LIEIKNLNFSYNNKQVLYNINLEIPAGKFISIIGPNGSGKSTLINILTKTFSINHGSIKLNNKCLKEYSYKDLSKIITYIQQNAVIRFPFTCMEVVLMARTPYKNRLNPFSKKDIEITEKCMEKTDTMQFINSYITEISGGEKQRVIFAKALAQDVKIFFLDEAFSSMDIQHQIKCLNILKNKIKNESITVVAVMHDLNMVNHYSDIVIALNKGSIFKYKSKAEVMQPKILKELFKVNFKTSKDGGILINPGKEYK